MRSRSRARAVRHNRIVLWAVLAIANTFVAAVTTYAIPNSKPMVQRSGITFSDHVNFWNDGYHAIFMIESESPTDPNWHTVNDRVSTLTWPFFVEGTQGLLATTCHLGSIIQ